MPGVLREFTGGRVRLEVPVGAGSATLGDLLDTIALDCPVFVRRVRDDRGDLRRHVNVFVNGCNARDLAGAGSPVTAATEVQVMPAISGG